jgi:hypothetical protein
MKQENNQELYRKLRQFLRALGEEIAELPKAHRARLLNPLEHLDSSHGDTARIAYLIRLIHKAKEVQEIPLLLEEGVKWGILAKVNTPIEGLPYFIAENGIYIPTNPRDKRQLRLLEEARGRNSELRKPRLQEQLQEK